MGLHLNFLLYHTYCLRRYEATAREKLRHFAARMMMMMMMACFEFVISGLSVCIVMVTCQQTVRYSEFSGERMCERERERHSAQCQRLSQQIR